MLPTEENEAAGRDEIESYSGQSQVDHFNIIPHGSLGIDIIDRVAYAVDVDEQDRLHLFAKKCSILPSAFIYACKWTSLFLWTRFCQDATRGLAKPQVAAANLLGLKVQRGCSPAASWQDYIVFTEVAREL